MRRSPLLPIALCLMLLGAGCPTTKPVAAPTPAPVTETPAQPVQGDANAFTVANGTLSHASFTITVPKGATVEGGAVATIKTASFTVEFSEVSNIDDALAAFKDGFKTRTVTDLAGRKVAFGTGGQQVDDGYVAILDGEHGLIIHISADTDSGVKAALAFVATIHWTDQK